MQTLTQTNFWSEASASVSSKDRRNLSHRRPGKAYRHLDATRVLPGDVRADDLVQRLHHPLFGLLAFIGLPRWNHPLFTPSVREVLR
jgi:hypothetical protein